jgi:ATP-dependent protease ClpP protease subunit
MFKSVPNKVRTFGCGFVGSAANLLFVAGDERYMYKSCRMYLHDGSASIGGDFSERALKSVSNEMVVLEDLYNDYMAENSHLTAKKVKEMCRAETYLSAEDCVRMGIADYLINDFPKKLKKLKKSKKKAKK